MSAAAAFGAAVSLAPLPRAAMSEVAHLQVPPAQRGYVGPIEAMTADADPLQRFFVVRAAGEAVGFFTIDADLSRRDARLPPGSHALRGLLIGGQYQRHGYGGAMLAALPDFVASAYPALPCLWLPVDEGNAPAIRAYGAHGWQSTGFGPVAGRSGPEILMMLPLAGA